MGDDNVDWEFETVNNSFVPHVIDDVGSDGDNSDVDISSDFGGEKGNTKNSQTDAEKREKKKRKFAEMKEAKKRVRNNEDENENNEYNDGEENKSNHPFFKSLEPESKLHELYGVEDFCEITSNENSNENPVISAILTNLPRFKKMIKNRGASNEELKGCPLVVIVCSSAIRATEIVKVLSNKLKCRIAKLFAKHIKIQQQIDILQMHDNPIAIGTPNRLHKLIELGSLNLSKSRLLIIDSSYLDKKEYSLLTLPGVSDDFKLFMEKSVSSEMDHIKLCCV